MRKTDTVSWAKPQQSVRAVPKQRIAKVVQLCPSAVTTPSFTLVRVTKKGGSLSKRVFRDESGKLTVDTSACAMIRGEARSVVVPDGMAGLARLYGALAPKEAVVFSNVDLGPAARELCTEADYAEQRQQNPNVICRSKRFLAATPAPGLQLFEVDDHGLPEGKSPPNAQGMVDQLAELLPELDVPGAARLLTHSTSSHIHDAGTGAQIKGEGGKHLAMLLSDLTRAKALKELLEVRQWATGHGHIHLSRDGKQLERTVFDLSVFAPERLVFEAGADLGEGLQQRRPDPVAVEGHALDMSRLPLPSVAERERASQAKRAAKEATRERAEQVRAAYVQAEAKKLVAQRSISQDEADRIVLQRTEAGSLDDGDVLVFTDKGGREEQLVGYVLDRIEQYVGRPMCDPLEPEKGPSKAMILRGPGGQPYIHSHVHGGRRFTFERIVGLQGASERSMFEPLLRLTEC
jgi:hypothetical protein